MSRLQNLAGKSGLPPIYASRHPFREICCAHLRCLRASAKPCQYQAHILKLVITDEDRAVVGRFCASTGISRDGPRFPHCSDHTNASSQYVCWPRQSERRFCLGTLAMLKREACISDQGTDRPPLEQRSPPKVWLFMHAPTHLSYGLNSKYPP